MNKTSIEWTDFTWNPITGCLHPCRNTYCYNTMKKTAPLNRFGAIYLDNCGKKISEKEWGKRETGRAHIAVKGEINPYGYDPTFYPHRLDEPLKIGKPARIFVVDTGDAFGEWVPQDWIKQVLDVVKRCPRHIFQFLTKNPQRLLEFEFPPNAWVGTSVNSDKDRRRVDILKEVHAKIRFLSIEPLLGEITFGFAGLQWIIIGAQTGEAPARPEPAWIDEILRHAKNLCIPVFLKNNIRAYCREFIQDYPGSTTLF